MASLTPHRDSLLSGLDEARHRLDALQATGARGFEVEMSFGVMKAALLPVADMLDRRMPFEDVQTALESALANLVSSHAMNVEDGDATGAASFAVDMLERVAVTVVKRLAANTPHVSVYRPVDHGAGGTA